MAGVLGAGGDEVLGTVAQHERLRARAVAYVAVESSETPGRCLAGIEHLDHLGPRFLREFALIGDAERKLSSPGGEAVEQHRPHERRLTVLARDGDDDDAVAVPHAVERLDVFDF